MMLSVFKQGVCLARIPLSSGISRNGVSNTVHGIKKTA
jgi:hypothetical protein